MTRPLPDTRCKALYVALAVSLCLHVLLFGEQMVDVVGNAWNSTASPALRARLRPMEAKHAAPGVSTPPRELKADAARATPTQMALGRAEAIAKPATPPQDAASAPSPTHANPEAPATSPSSSEASGGQSQAEGKRRYLVSLATAARRIRDYPRDAQSEGRSGTTVVRLDIAPGHTPDVRVEQGSGDARLDAAAMTMIGRAAIGVPLPDSLRGHNFSVAVPVEFSADGE